METIHSCWLKPQLRNQNIMLQLLLMASSEYLYKKSFRFNISLLKLSDFRDGDQYSCNKMIKQSNYFCLDKYDDLAPLEKQYSPRRVGLKDIAFLGELNFNHSKVYIKCTLLFL